MATKKVLKVLKEAEKTPRDYELIVVLDPEVADEALDTSLDNISQIITGKSGVVAGVERWGKRKLAYPIGHSVEGNYVLIRFQGKPTLCHELEVSLRISEEILRYLLIKVGS